MEESSGSEDDQWSRSGEDVFRCAFTNDCDRNYVRANLGSTYLINYPHPTDAGQVIRNIAVKLDSETGLSNYVNPLNPADGATGTACYWWEATVSYAGWNPLEHTPSGNPVDQPIDLSFLWTVNEQPCDVAITGKNPDGSYIFSPVLNSANCPFDPPVVRDELRCAIRISQNLLTYNPAAFWNLGNCINNDEDPLWNGFGQFTVKWTPPNMPQRLYSQFLGQIYYRLDHEFNFNPQGWNATPIDRGFSALGSGGYPEKILDLYGQPVSEPVLLDGSGNRLLNPSPTNYKAFNFQTCNDINFVNTFGATFQNLFTTP